MEGCTGLPFSLSYDAKTQQVCLSALPGSRMDLHHFEKDKGCWVFQLVAAATADAAAETDRGKAVPSAALSSNTIAAAKPLDSEKAEPDYVKEARQAAARAAKGLNKPKPPPAKPMGLPSYAPPPPPPRPSMDPQLPKPFVAPPTAHPQAPRPQQAACWDHFPRNPPRILTRVPGAPPGSRMAASCDSSPSHPLGTTLPSLDLIIPPFPRATSVPPTRRNIFGAAAALSAPATPALSGGAAPMLPFPCTTAAVLQADRPESLGTLSTRSDDSVLGSGDFGESLKEEWVQVANSCQAMHPSGSATGQSSPEGPLTPGCIHDAPSPAQSFQKTVRPPSAPAPVVEEQSCLPRNFSACKLAPGFFSFLDEDTAAA